MGKHSFVAAVLPIAFLSLSIVVAVSCSSKSPSLVDSLDNFDASNVQPMPSSTSMPETSTLTNVPDVTSPPATEPQMEAAAPVDASDASLALDASDAMVCEAGQTNCDGLCVSTLSDVNNCGQCGNACGGVDSQCISGVCSCKTGFSLCGTQCVDLTSDSANCGICTYKCQGQPCVGSLCVPSQIVHNYQVIDIGVDQTNVYFTAGGTQGGVYFKPFASQSNPLTISAIPNENLPTGIAIGVGATLTDVYWVDLGSGGLGVSQVILTDFTPPVYYESPPLPAGPYAITVDGTNLYWVDTQAGTVNQLPLSAMRYPPDAGEGTAPQVLASGQAAPKAIAVDATSVYWVNYGSALSSTGSVNKVPIGGNNSQVVSLATGESQPNDIKVDAALGDGYVYWVDQAQRLVGGAVKRASITGGGGAAMVLAGMQGAPTALYLDAKYVYWTNYDDGTVQKMPRTGIGDAGTIVPLATMQDTPKAIAVDSVNVYWSNSGPGDIWKVAKGP